MRLHHPLLCALLAFTTACNGRSDPNAAPDAGLPADDADASPDDPPIPPGRVVGLRAVNSVGGADIASEEMEIALEPGSSPARAPAPVAPASRARERMTGPTRRTRRAAPADRVARLTAPAAVDDPFAAASDCEDRIGSRVEQMGTINGSICYVSYGEGSGTFGAEDAVSGIVFFSPEGMYYALEESQSLYVPPDFQHAGVTVSVGCIVSPDGDTVNVDYLQSLSSAGISFNVGIFSVGLTFPFEPGQQRFLRGIQYNTGYSIGVSLLPVTPIGLSQGVGSSYVAGPTLVGCYDDSQAADGMAFAPATGDDNPFAVIAAGLQTLAEQPATDYRSVLRGEMARSMLPFFELVSDTTASVPEQDRPAATNADLYADWFGRPGTALCDDCPNTSLDFLIAEWNDGILAAGNDTSAMVAVGASTRARQQQIFPQLVRQAAVQRATGAGVTLAELVHADLAAEARGDTNRYIADEIIPVPGAVGERADFTITAEEIAELLDVEPSAIEGALVTIGAEPRVGSGTFELIDGEVTAGFTPQETDSYLVQVEVDLTTAAGAFPDDVGDWVVRPAMRLLQPASGGPAHAYLTGPARADAGATVALNAMVLDDAYNPVSQPTTVRFVDAEDQLLGEVSATGGIAELRIRPRPTVPRVARVEPTTLVFGDDSTGPGFEVVGTGFSRDAAVWIDDQSLTERDARWAVISSRSVLFSADDVALAPGEHTLRVDNPDGIDSDVLTFTVE